MPPIIPKPDLLPRENETGTRIDHQSSNEKLKHPKLVSKTSASEKLIMVLSQSYMEKKSSRNNKIEFNACDMIKEQQDKVQTTDFLIVSQRICRNDLNFSMKQDNLEPTPSSSETDHLNQTKSIDQKVVLTTNPDVPAFILKTEDTSPDPHVSINEEAFSYENIFQKTGEVVNCLKKEYSDHNLVANVPSVGTGEDTISLPDLIIKSGYLSNKNVMAGQESDSPELETEKIKEENEELLEYHEIKLEGETTDSDLHIVKKEETSPRLEFFTKAENTNSDNLMMRKQLCSDATSTTNNESNIPELHFYSREDTNKDRKSGNAIDEGKAKRQKTQTRKKAKDLSELYFCADCPFYTHRISGLERHIESIHNEEHMCNECLYRTKCRKAWYAHLTEHANMVLKGQGQEIPSYNKCPVCDFVSNKRADMYSHIETKHTITKNSKSNVIANIGYSCLHCGFFTKFERGIELHIRWKQCTNQGILKTYMTKNRLDPCTSTSD